MFQIDLKTKLEIQSQKKNKNECPNIQLLFSTEKIYSDFILFFSTYDILYLIYQKDKFIIAYNILEKKIINKIKANFYSLKDIDRNIIGYTKFKHYFDKINNRDLLITYYSNYIYLWNVNNWECLFHIERKNLLFYKLNKCSSICFLNDNNQILISVLNFSTINIYDINGKNIKQYKCNNKNIVFYECYFDIKMSKSYIILSSNNYIESIDFKNSFKIYHNYSEKEIDDEYEYKSVIVNNIGNITILIESCSNGILRLWNFHSGELLKKIIVCKNFRIFSFCLWNNTYILVGCTDNTIKLIDLETEKCVKKLKGYNVEPESIIKAKNVKYGEYLVTKSRGECLLRIWKNINY